MTTPKLATARSGWGGRGYYIPDEVDDAGKRKVFPSVTTILSQVSKNQLHQWAADQTAAAAVVNLPWLMQQTEEVGYGMLRFIWNRKLDLEGDALDPVRQHYIRVRNDAAELGTNIHEWIEAHLDELTPYPEMISDESAQMADAFLDWLEGHEVVSRRAEFTVFNPDVGYAGTADADWDIACLHGGETCLGQAEGEFVRTLIDLKSSRYTWREHGMQLSLLADAKTLMVEVPEGFEGALKHETTRDGVKMRSWWVRDAAPEFTSYALLHIRPDDLDTKGNAIPAFCVLHDMTPKMDIYRKGARGAFLLAEAQFEEKTYNRLHAIVEQDEEDETEGF